MSVTRLLWRWNVRVLRRQWRQYVAIVVLVGAGVALATGAVTLAHNLSAPPSEGLGRGDVALSVEGDPDRLAAALDANGATYGRFQSAQAEVGGRVERVDVRAIDPDNATTAPLLGLRDGRWPDGPDEVAVTERAVLDGGRLGARFTLAGRPVTVVGRVENPTDLGDEFVLFSSLDDLQGVDVATRFYVEDGDGATTRLEIGGVTSTASSGTSTRGIVTMLTGVLGALGLVQVGLLVTAGFSVLARRRTRQFGLLAACGAAPSHVRRAAGAVGILVGVPAAAAGATAGVIAAAAVAPHFESSVGRRIDVDVPWAWIVGVTAFAVAVALTAARRPATAMASTPLAELVDGRPPTPRPARRMALIGSVVGLLGVLALAAGFSRLDPTLALLGAITAPTGVLALAPLSIQALGRTGSRFPLPGRLAARSLQRAGGRAPAVVAAVALAAALPASTILITATLDQERAARGPDLGEGWIAVWQPGTIGSGTWIPADLDPDALDAGVDRLGQVAEPERHVGVDVAVDPNARRSVEELRGVGPAAAVEPLMSGRPGSEECLSCDVTVFADGDGNESTWFPGGAWIGSTPLLEFLDLDTEDIERGQTAAVTRRHDTQLLANGGAVQAASPITVGSEYPVLARVPDALVAPYLVDEIGFEAVRIGYLADLGESPSPLQRAEIRRAVGPELVVEFHDPPPTAANVRGAATLAGIVLGLVIAVGSVGMLTAEMGGEVRVLRSIGATPQLRRRLVAAMAGFVAASGALLGLAIGAMSVIPLLVAPEADYAVAFPAGSLVALAVGLPAATTAVAFVAVRP